MKRKLKFDECLDELTKTVTVRGNTVINSIFINGKKEFEYMCKDGKIYARREVDRDEFDQAIMEWIQVRQSSFPNIMTQLNLTRIGLKSLLKKNNIRKYLPNTKAKLIRLLMDL